MEMRQRHDQIRDAALSPIGETPAAPGNPLATQQATASLAAIDSILEQALSGDSESFLRANRQTGGQ